MQVIRTIWVVNFFLFSLILLFVWSKVVIISKRVTQLLPLIKKVQELRSELRGASKQNPAQQQKSA